MGDNKWITGNKLLPTKVDEARFFLQQLVDDPTIDKETKLKYIINGASLCCGILAAQPIPFMDIVILSPLQVSMVYALSRVIGIDGGENSAKEVLTYITGVVGFGFIAQHTIMGLYKTIIPFAGAITTVPLVYAATYSMGYAARAILEARMKDRKITDEEIHKIKIEAEKKAQARAKGWKLADVHQELKDLRQKCAEYHRKFEVEHRHRNLAEDKNFLQKRKIEEQNAEIIDLKSKVEIAFKLQSEAESKLEQKETQLATEREKIGQLKKDIEITRWQIDSMSKHEQANSSAMKRKIEELEIMRKEKDRLEKQVNDTSVQLKIMQNEIENKDIELENKTQELMSALLNNQSLQERYENISLAIKEKYHYLDKKSLNFLATAEGLLQIYSNPKNDIDFAPVMVEYCKVVENELRLFLRKGKRASLGDLIKEINKGKHLLLYQHLEEFQCIHRYRNGSAHANPSSKEAVNEVRNVLFNERSGILTLFSKLKEYS